MTAKAARTAARRRPYIDIGRYGGRRPACRPHRSRYDIWYLSCRGRSVGAGKIATALARTEQVSRIRSGWPRSIPTSRACTFASRPRSLQRAGNRRRRVAPLAWLRVALRLRQACPRAKAPQCRHNPDGLARRVAGSTDWRLVAGVDDRGDKMQEPQIHCCCPCLVPQIWAATAQDRQSGQLNPQ